jgi:hypothetical protein
MARVALKAKGGVLRAANPTHQNGRLFGQSRSVIRYDDPGYRRTAYFEDTLCASR